MGLSGKLLQIIALPGVLIIIFAIVAAAAATTTATISKPDCPSHCGDVEIPFPFGLKEGCFLDDSFNITCDDSRTPKTGNVNVKKISIETHELHVLTYVAQDCYQKKGDSVPVRNAYCSKDRGRKLLGEAIYKNDPRPTDPRYNDKDGGFHRDINPYDKNYGASGNRQALPCVPTVRVQGHRYKNNPWFRVSQYTISNSKNKFTVMGCDNIAYLSGYQNGDWYSIGCASRCLTLSNVVNGSCSGIGCCEVGFPDGLKNISVEVFSYNNHSNVWDFNPCGYAFVVEKGEFNFTADYLKKYINRTVPMVLDWAVGNLKCEEAQNKPNFACTDINSECIDLQTRQDGYRCQCKQGYKGNPYLQGKWGCQGNLLSHPPPPCYFLINLYMYFINYDYTICADIDECENSTLNNCAKLCTNGIGNYTCGCPRWYRGDGTKDGEGCSVDVVLAIKVSIGK